MRVLVVGSNGLLGGNVVETAREQGFEAAGTYHMSKPSFEIPLEKLDLREVEQLRSIVNEFSPHVVVNCAAMTDVDGCESDPDTACAVNGDAPGVIAEICDEANSYLVHVSTDYVFDGCARRPYKESDDPSPKQVYGESKLAGERSVRDTEADALVTRLSFVYGIHRSNGELTGFPAWVYDRFRRDEPTPLFTDQHVTPTRAGQAASTILELAEQRKVGTVHVACRSCVTPYEFGEAIRRRMNASSELLESGSMSDVDRSAERPKYTCLDVTHVADLLDRPQPTLDDDLIAIESVFDSVDGSG